MLRSDYLDNDVDGSDRAQPIYLVLYVVVRVVLYMQLETQTNIWQPFLQAVERRLGKQAVATWFRPLKVSDCSTPGVLIIAAPNMVVRDWIVSNYANVLDESLTEIALDSCRIQWTVRPFQGGADSGEVSGLVESRSADISLQSNSAEFVTPSSENRPSIAEPGLPATDSPTPRPKRSPRCRAGLTTLSTSTAVWAWARPIFSKRQVTRSDRPIPNWRWRTSLWSGS